MSTILVTGGAGFIGANFIRYVLKHEPTWRVVNLDALAYSGLRENLDGLSDPSRHTFVEGDIGDAALLEKLFREHRFERVVHFAAESHVDRSISGPAAFIQTNIVGTFTLLEAARKAWITDKLVPVAQARFHHVSTDEVFGSLGKTDPAFNEHTAYDPRSPYSASKASSDHLVRAYQHTYGLPITISNCSNNYGPYQFPEKLLPLMILNALEGKALPVYGDGQQVRDWLHVDDHCEAIRRILNKGRAGETYLIGGGNQPANLELVERICALLDERKPESKFKPHRSLVKFVADRPGHDRRYAIDYSKIERELGWKPSLTLEAGLRLTVDWYLTNTAWITAVRARAGYADWLKQNYERRTKA